MSVKADQAQGDIVEPKPAPVDDRTSARSINAHRWTKSDGDLRKLLAPKPQGARYEGASEGRWVSIVEFAAEAESPTRMFRYLSNSGLRRIASRQWRQGAGTYVTIRLIQFRPTSDHRALDFVEEQSGYTRESSGEGDAGEPIPGSRNGTVWVYGDDTLGGRPYYRAKALAWRGDVAMEIWLASVDGPISPKEAMSVAKEQWERL
ncbi:hypothetical protein [Streptomyces sp. NPDC006879]|uniref:hypothetical protein n=1 Tax=Streptomyces sp. NPDC006879 TaxID=3364767 RepID=UPI003699C300